MGTQCAGILAKRMQQVTRCGRRVSWEFLEKDDPGLLSKWLSLFVTEVRKVDWSCYPPATINLLLCGLQCICNTITSLPSIFLVSMILGFEDFMVQWSQSTNNYIEGIGCEVKHASVITEEEEDLLWITEVFGDQSPKALFCSIFFFNG